MKKIEYLGYTISQASNNHIMICKDNEMVMHISCSKELTEDELKEKLDFYFYMKNSVEKHKEEIFKDNLEIESRNK